MHRGAGSAPVAIASVDTPIGRHWLAGSTDGLVQIIRSEDPEPLFESLHRHRLDWAADVRALDAARAEIAAFYSGALQVFSVPLDLRGVSSFDGAVYRAAMRIPYGETASYGDVAAMAGSPRAGRAVGGAMARCRLFPIVPCHRVVHADGSIAGWGPDLWIKRWLLDLERVHSG